MLVSLIQAYSPYSGKLNNILYSNNCHSHVARALNKYNYNGKSNYTMIGNLKLLKYFLRQLFYFRCLVDVYDLK